MGTAQLCIVRRTIRCLFIFCGWQHPTSGDSGPWTGRGCTNPEIRRWPLGGNELMVSTSTIYISTHYLYIYTVSTEYLHSIYRHTENEREATPLRRSATPRTHSKYNYMIILSPPLHTNTALHWFNVLKCQLSWCMYPFKMANHTDGNRWKSC